jgi:DNA polymerase III epsilon subunit-like protein
MRWDGNRGDATMNKIVFFDLETSGLDYKKHEVIQIAARAVDENFRGVDRFAARVTFDKEKADPDALKINHYTEEAWASALSPHQAAADFGAFLSRHATIRMTSKAGNPYRVAQLAGHNVASFDFPFLRALFYRDDDRFLPAGFITLDTLQLAAWTFRVAQPENAPENLKLGTLAEFFGIEVDAEAELHDAEADVAVNVAVARALLAWRARMFNGDTPTGSNG